MLHHVPTRSSVRLRKTDSKSFLFDELKVPDAISNQWKLRVLIRIHSEFYLFQTYRVFTVPLAHCPWFLFHSEQLLHILVKPTLSCQITWINFTFLEYISLYIIWSDSFGSECFWCDHGWMWTIVSTYSKCDHCQTPLIITIVNHMHGQPAAVFGSHVTNCNTELSGTF